MGLSEKKKPVLETGKRKMAIAKAIVKPGKGRVWVNDYTMESLTPDIARMKVMEPLIVAGDRAKSVDIKVSVEGGGVMGQAEAARIAIARGLAGWTKSSELRKSFQAFDRTMLAGDQRMSEPKKFGGPSARRRKQKSYR
jgi:small subunit ribosomal protein S9